MQGEDVKQKQKCTKFQNLVHWSPPALATGGEKEISALVVVHCRAHSKLHSVHCTALHTAQRIGWCTPVTQSEPFLASQDALEMMEVTRSLTESALAMTLLR